MAANEGGNAIIMTDTLTNIRRFTEIVHALDTSIASVSAVQVFQLKYADAKALSTVIRDLFSSTDTGNRSSGNQQNQNVFRGMRGGGFPGGGFPGGGFPGAAAAAGGGGSDAGSSGNSRVSTPKVVAVADERSNALVVSAPEAQMAVIKDLVEQVDTNVEDVTELRVFRLQHADPQEMAEVIAGLFPDPTSSSSQGGRGGQVRFGGGGFGGFGGAFGGGNRGTGAGTGASSERLLKQSKVVSVPDLRTSSIVVSASHELMEQIASMVERLDADPARKQKVFVYSVENSDPQAVEDILRGLFENQNSSRNRSTTRNNNRQTGNQLNNRATQTQNQGNRSNTGLGANTRGATGFGGQ
jgi:type II secretory pathway component GspD/PulD (secretin)